MKILLIKYRTWKKVITKKQHLHPNASQAPEQSGWLVTAIAHNQVFLQSEIRKKYTGNTNTHRDENTQMRRIQIHIGLISAAKVGRGHHIGPGQQSNILLQNKY